MSKISHPQNEKKERLHEIKESVQSFCVKYINEELESYAIKLCDTLGRKRRLNISRGSLEIWAASIIYVIAHLNFLFDQDNENHITTDIICNFFNTNKSTIGSKTTQIKKVCNLTIGAEGYCSQEITDTFTYYQTPEGFIIPKRMIDNLEYMIELEDDDQLSLFGD